MKGLGILLISLSLFMAIAIQGCTPKLVNASSGEKVICSECGKTIASDIKTMQVPVSDLSKYVVHEKKETCAKCQAKIDAQKRAQEREEARKRRAEEARIRREEKQARIGRIVGTWVNNNQFSPVEICLNSDYTGSLKCGGKYNFHWTPTSDGFNVGSINVSIDPANPEIHSFSGVMSNDGQSMMIHGYGFFGFGRGASMQFQRF